MSVPKLERPLSIRERNALAVTCDRAREPYVRGQHVPSLTRLRVDESYSNAQIPLYVVGLAALPGWRQFKISEQTRSFRPVASNDAIEPSWDDPGTLQERLLGHFPDRAGGQVQRVEF